MFIIHYFLHLVFPILFAKLFFKARWMKAYLLMLATMLVDLDHVLADPIYDPSRCSIGFHPLHSELAILIYFLALLIPNWTIRVLSIALIAHMGTDLLDCYF